MAGDLIYKDGTFVGAEHASQGLFVYRFVRTIGHQPQLLAGHLAQLDKAADAIFARRCDIDEASCEAIIASLLRRNCCSERFSHIVMIRMFANGSTEILFHDTSLYDGIALRALQPKAVAVTAYDSLAHHRSSATLATTELHRAYAARCGADVAIALNEAGELLSIDGAAPSIVCGRKIIFSPQTVDEPEYDAMMRIATEQNRPMECRAIRADELLRADELFYIDHRGVTAVALYEGHRYADIVVNRLACDMASR